MIKEYGDLVENLQKTYKCSYIPDNKEALNELVSYKNKDGKLFSTKNKILKDYLESLLPNEIFENTQMLKEVLEELNDPENDLEYGLPQVCLENFIDKKFREQFEKRSNNFLTRIGDKNPARYDEFNFVPEFLNKCKNSWKVETEFTDKKGKIKAVKFKWTGVDIFTSKKQLKENTEGETSEKLNKSVYSIYKVYAQGEYSKLFIGQKYGGKKAQKIEEKGQSIKKYIELGFEIIEDKINGYTLLNNINNEKIEGIIIRRNCKTDTENDIKNYQIDKINESLQRFNNYIPWDLNDDFRNHKNGKMGSLLKTLYDDCRFAPLRYKSKQLHELFTDSEREFINQKFDEIKYVFKKSLSGKQLNDFNFKTENTFLDIDNIFDRVKAISFYETIYNAPIIQEFKNEKNYLEIEKINELFSCRFDESKKENRNKENEKWENIKEKWLNNKNQNLNTYGNIYQKGCVSGIFSDDVEYEDEMDPRELIEDEDEMGDKEEIDSETGEFSELNEAEILEEEKITDYDNDIADIEVGIDSSESEKNDLEQSNETISEVLREVKQLFNAAFRDNNKFLKIMDSWLDFVLEDFFKPLSSEQKLKMSDTGLEEYNSHHYDPNKKNNQNEYDAIINGFEKFRSGGNTWQNLFDGIYTKTIPSYSSYNATSYRSEFNEKMSGIKKDFKCWAKKNSITT